MPAPANQEWLNQNSYRSYPFREDVQLVPTNAPTVEIPDYLFVDMVLTTAGDAAVTVELSRLAYVGGFLTCIFRDSLGAMVATLTVDTAAHTAYEGYALTGQDTYEDARGIVVLGDLSRLSDDLPDGSYTFNGVAFEHCTVRPDIRGVRSVRVGYEDTLSDFIRGHLKLIEGSNIRFTYDATENAIRVDAIEGAGFNQECDCEDTYERPEPIRYFNGVNAENVQFVGDGKCVEVTTSGNRIIFKDTCSEPCCGCPELEYITSRLELLETVLRRVEEYATQMRMSIDDTINVMLSSTKGG